MFKLILVGIMAYLGYSMYLRYAALKRANKTKDSKKNKDNYSKLEISDADFEDISDN